MVKYEMVELSLSAKWEQFLKGLAADHQIDLNAILNDLCEWAFPNPEGKEQFEDWLENAYTSKGEAEDEERALGEEIVENEEEIEEESEEESHEHRD